MHGLEAEYWGQIDFLYIDREDPMNADLNRLLGVRTQPEFYFIEADGTLIESWFGARSVDEMRATLDSYLTEGG